MRRRSHPFRGSVEGRRPSFCTGSDNGAGKNTQRPQHGRKKHVFSPRIRYIFLEFRQDKASCTPVRQEFALKRLIVLASLALALAGCTAQPEDTLVGAINNATQSSPAQATAADETSASSQAAADQASGEAIGYANATARKSRKWTSHDALLDDAQRASALSSLEAMASNTARNAR